MHRRWTTLLYLVCALMPGVAAAWSQTATELAQQAESEFPARLVVVGSWHEAAARGLPGETQRQLRAAENSSFVQLRFKGFAAPFRRHWFDQVRCVIYLPQGATDADAELWTLAHEIGHCVARLEGWQASLWTDPSVVVRHRVESWADAFAVLLTASLQRPALAPMALLQRKTVGGDAAYATDRAILCAQAAAHDSERTLAALGREVQMLLQPACLTDAAHLRATEAFMTSLK